MNTRGTDPEDTTDFEEEDEDEMFARRDRSRHRAGGGMVSDFVRRAIENAVGTGSVSRDALSYLFQQGDRGKREVVRIVAKEVGDFLRQTDISSEVVKILTGVQVEFTASVRFKPTAEGRAVKPEIEASPKVRLMDSEGRDYLEREDDRADPDPHEPEADPSRDPTP